MSSRIPNSFDLLSDRCRNNEKTDSLEVRIQALEKQLADYQYCQNKNSIEHDRLYDDNASLRKQLANVSKFPATMRKMWSGGEVQAWIDKQLTPPAKEDES